MNKQTKIILISVVIVTFFFILNNFNHQSMSVSVSLVNPSIKPFAISVDKDVYVQGEIVRIKDSQELNADCEVLQSIFRLKKGDEILQEREVVMTLSGYLVGNYEVTVDTSKLEAGQYIIESNWVCDGEYLGRNGILDEEVTPSISAFNVIEEQENSNIDNFIIGALVLFLLFVIYQEGGKKWLKKITS